MTRRYSLALLILAPGLVAAVSLLGRADSATGAGALDQHLIGNPDCSYEALQGGVGIGEGALQQEFVPSMSALTSVDVCIVLHAPDTLPALDFNIRRGTAEHPGAVIAYKSLDGPQNLQWFHVEFDPLAVVPGEKLVLEVNGRFGWRATCSQVGGPCDHIDPDLYPAGHGYSEDLDFAFRTYGNNDPAPEPGPPPLTIQWGNLDCGTYITGSDILLPLAAAAGVTVPQPAPGAKCPVYGESVTVYNRERQWGDVDCLDNGAVKDALYLALSSIVGGFTYPRDVACPRSHQYVNVDY
jgi:hypothetical protein